jgi:hypothetical protein
VDLTRHLSCPSSVCLALPERDAFMSIESDHPPAVSWNEGDPGVLITTIEEADDARRRAAEIGDYVMAQRWLWHERQLAAQQDILQPPALDRVDRHDPIGK